MAQLQLPRVLLLLPAGRLRVLSGCLSQIFLVERLVKAGGEAVFPEKRFLHVVACRNGHHRELCMGVRIQAPYVFQYVETVHGRHLYVCEQQIETVLFYPAEHFFRRTAGTISQAVFPVGFVVTSLGSVAFGYGRRQSAIYGEDVPEIQGHKRILRRS